MATRILIDPETVTYRDDGNAARISCTINGDSYHIWVVPDTLELNKSHGAGILYKNPPASSPYTARTRHLSAAVETNRRIIVEMIRIVRERGLIEADRARKAAERERYIAEQAELARQIRIRDAAQDLYSALYVMRALFVRKPDGTVEFKDGLLDVALLAADNVLKLADEGTPVNTVQPGELTQ